jgi:preprotein translocase subunit YajC
VKFKVGDKVKIVNDNFSNGMYMGMEGIIEKFDIDDQNFIHYIVKLGNEYLWFIEDELELVEDNNNHNNIQIGDHVKITTIYDDDILNGLIGKIVEIDDEEVEIELFEANKRVRVLKEEVIKMNNQKKSFQEIATEIGKFTDMKNEAYGSSVDATYEVLKIFLKKYKNDDNTYTIPESLLKHILLQVRMIDKQNRIFNNPDGDKLGESQYNDITGYGLIGVRMMEK